MPANSPGIPQRLSASALINRNAYSAVTRANARSFRLVRAGECEKNFQRWDAEALGNQNGLASIESCDGFAALSPNRAGGEPLRPTTYVRNPMVRVEASFHLRSQNKF
jgi:hypothetical protein